MGGAQSPGERYGQRESPALFRSAGPAWEDSNLRELAAEIRVVICEALVALSGLWPEVRPGTAGGR